MLKISHCKYITDFSKVPGPDQGYAPALEIGVIDDLGCVSKSYIWVNENGTSFRYGEISPAEVGVPLHHSTVNGMCGYLNNYPQVANIIKQGYLVLLMKYYTSPGQKHPFTFGSKDHSSYAGYAVHYMVYTAGNRVPYMTSIRLADMELDHINKNTWDNHYKNIQCITKEEHQKKHSTQKTFNKY